MEPVAEILPVSRPSLAMMQVPPEDPAECDRIGNELWLGLALRYERIAPARELELLRRGPGHQTEPSPDYLWAEKQFDEFLLGMFAEFGWRMLLSKELVRTVARWESLHPELLERLGSALALKSRIFRGEKSAPLLEGTESFADETIEELRRLLRLMRDDFRQRTGPPPRCERIAGWMKVEIEAHPKDFPNLHAHLGQLHAYVANYLPAKNKKAARLLESGAVRAESFFYQWYAVATNRSVRDIRNLISRRRRRH
jgi:hypothetical protein